MNLNRHLLLLAVALLTGCGEKKRAKTHIPAPPPPITDEQAAPTAKQPVDTKERHSDEYKDAKILFTQTGLAKWYETLVLQSQSR